MVIIISLIDKILNKFLSLYLILRYLYFVYVRRKFKFLEEVDKKKLSFNKISKQHGLEKNLNFRSQLFNLKKFGTSLRNFSGSRISILLNQLPSFDYIKKDEIKTLIIGPRTEGDIYQALLSGIKKENLFAIDLFTYSPFITLGDMHNIPFKDNTFDLILSGWTLTYSEDNKKAIDEIIRVSKNNCLVGIGYTFKDHHFHQDRIINSEKLFSLFGDSLKDVHFKYHPNDQVIDNIKSKRSIYMIKVKK